VVTVLAPAEGEYLPAAHGVHPVAEVLYVPAAHAVHTVVPVYPLLQTQAEESALGDESVGQAVHVVRAVCSSGVSAL